MRKTTPRTVEDDTTITIINPRRSTPHTINTSKGKKTKDTVSDGNWTQRTDQNVPVGPQGSPRNWIPNHPQGGNRLRNLNATVWLRRWPLLDRGWERVFR